MSIDIIIVIVIDGRGYDQAIDTTFVQIQAHHRVVGLLDLLFTVVMMNFRSVCYVCYDLSFSLSSRSKQVNKVPPSQLPLIFGKLSRNTIERFLRPIVV